MRLLPLPSIALRSENTAATATCADELATAPDEPAQQRCLAAHPRFNELSAKYGPLAPSAPPPAAGSSLAGSMVEVALCYGAKKITKKLPGGCAARRGSHSSVRSQCAW